MFDDVKDMIFKLFGKRVKSAAYRRDIQDVEAFCDTSRENLTAVFANSLSTLAFADCSVSVIGADGVPNLRSRFLDELAQKHWRSMKQNIAVGNGCGMIATIPYAQNRKIYLDTVAKDRFFITGQQGDEVTRCTVISDVKVVGSVKYIRFTDYSLENGVYIIRQKAVRNSSEVPLTEVADWADIAPEIRIGNVKKLPIGIYRCPASGRKTKNAVGVPITYGCEATMNKIAKCLDEIEREYKNKSVKIFADGTLFDKDKKLSDVYVKLRPSGRIDGGGGIDVFDPAFRDSALYNRLEHLYAQLEKEVGTSRGILTDLQTNGATATEIKRAAFQTFALCDDIRSEAEQYFKDVLYGADVLCEFYGLTPRGEYKTVFDRSYSLLEDSAETFNQLLSAHGVGAVDTAEIRRFVIGTETAEEAEQKVLRIAEQK